MVVGVESANHACRHNRGNEQRSKNATAAPFGCTPGCGLGLGGAESRLSAREGGRPKAWLSLHAATVWSADVVTRSCAPEVRRAECAIADHGLVPGRGRLAHGHRAGAQFVVVAFVGSNEGIDFRTIDGWLRVFELMVRFLGFGILAARAVRIIACFRQGDVFVFVFLKG